MLSSAAANSAVLISLLIGGCVLLSTGGSPDDPLEYDEVEKKQETRHRPDDRFGKTIRRNAPGKVHGNFVRIGRQHVDKQVLAEPKDEDQKFDDFSSDVDRCLSLVSQNGDKMMQAGRSSPDISDLRRCVRSLLVKLENSRDSDVGLKRSGSGVNSNVKFVRIGRAALSLE